MGYSPWDCKEWDMTGQLSLSLIFHLEKSKSKNNIPQIKLIDTENWWLLEAGGKGGVEEVGEGD